MPEDAISPFAEGALRSKKTSLRLTSPTKTTLSLLDLEKAFQVIAHQVMGNIARSSPKHTRIGLRGSRYWKIEREPRWEPERILSHIEGQVGLLVKTRSASAPANSPGQPAALPASASVPRE